MTREDFFKTVERLQDMRYEERMLKSRLEELEEQIDDEYTDLCLCMDINGNNRAHDNLDEMLCEYCFNPDLEMPLYCGEIGENTYREIQDLAELYDYIKEKTKE